MNLVQQSDDVLPPLREDLNIASGAPLLNGAPSWVIYDPIRHRFFQVGQRTIEMISKWSYGSQIKLIEYLKQTKGLTITTQEIQALIQFLKANDLLAETKRGQAKLFEGRAAERQSTLVKWALHRYIFFRIPLLRPNKFLHATWPFVSPIFSRGYVYLTLVTLIVALYLAGRQYSDVLSHFRNAFSFEGVITYIIALIFVKVLHELGHAYQAVSRGLKVPTIGVAFIVLFPLLYTDTTDVWRLRNRQDRVMVDLGGIFVELSLAVYSTLLWCFLPDGSARDAMFAVATTSWFFSLLVNLNPLMRFDGYYLLADSLGVHNLQPRSFEMGRWALREILFGLGHPPPEQHTQRMRIFMIIYAYATWIYRFFLFLAIALIVYAISFKALGVTLFIAEIAFFIFAPISRELKKWYAMRSDIVRTRRSKLTFLLILGLVALAATPISRSISAPALLDEARQYTIYASTDAQLSAIHVEEGAFVGQDELLFTLVDSELDLLKEQVNHRIALYEARLQAAAGDRVERAQRLVLESQLEKEKETLVDLENRLQSLQIRTEQSGVLSDLADDAQPGTWLSRETLLARVIDPNNQIIRGQVDEDASDRIDWSKGSVFIADDPVFPRLTLDNVQVFDLATKFLPNQYLASIHGGAVPVTVEQEVLRTRGVWYAFEAQVAQAKSTAMELRSPKTGVVVFSSKPESFLYRIMRRVAKVLIREADL